MRLEVDVAAASSERYLHLLDTDVRLIYDSILHYNVACGTCQS